MKRLYSSPENVWEVDCYSFLYLTIETSNTSTKCFLLSSASLHIPLLWLANHRYLKVILSKVLHNYIIISLILVSRRCPIQKSHSDNPCFFYYELCHLLWMILFYIQPKIVKNGVHESLVLAKPESDIDHSADISFAQFGHLMSPICKNDWEMHFSSVSKYRRNRVW